MCDNYGMQYIMDGNGNYYTLNSEDQLVVAKDRDTAGVFTFYEANQRIGAGKRAKFYLTIPVENLEETERELLVAGQGSEELSDNSLGEVSDKLSGNSLGEVSDNLSGESQAQPAFEYSIDHTDWLEFVNYYIFLATSIKGYQDELAKQHSDVEKEICDLLHYVEIYDLSDDEGLKAMDMLKDARQRRRDVKDELSRIEHFQRQMGTSGNIARAKIFRTELKKLDTRKYYPRQLEGLFDGMEGRQTDREAFRLNRELENSCKAAACDEEDYSYYEEEVTEMSFVETVFDKRDNDWLGFAKQQMEFYQNADQYMTNLKIAIATIDTAIEDVMEKIEDANYNVAQGYMVFKELKNLRNERKDKVQEIEILRAMTECFDMDSMADALSYNVEEIERITSAADTNVVAQKAV